MTAQTVDSQNPAQRGAGLLASPPRAKTKKPVRPARILLHAFLIFTALSFLFPLLWAAYTSLRPYSDTAVNGYFSIARSLSFTNYTHAWSQGQMPKFFVNTMYVAIPSLIFILLFSSFVAFGLARFRVPGRKTLLVIFTAGNLLPQQILITPLVEAYRQWDNLQFVIDHPALTIYDTYLGVIFVHVAFQIGFCTFVLTNYMETLPQELTEAAMVDGASVWRQFWQVTMPLCKPALGALATLEFTWIYNDFLWALTLMSTGDKRPITSALNNLRGEFFSDNNLLAAGSLIIALPTMIVYFILQKQFIGGLTLGANKG
jgi:multiple sugar transport system permease protein